MDKYTELPLDDAGKIISFDWYDSRKTTVIFAHGFTGKQDSNGMIRDVLVHAKVNTEYVLVRYNLNFFSVAAELPCQGATGATRARSDIKA